MSADENILKSFLYQIGAKLDEPSLRKAEDSLEKLSKGILAIGASIEALALGLAAATVKIADSFEDMYYASRRTGASIKAMKVFDYTVSQLGGSADAAQASIEGLADQLQRNPMLQNWIKGQLHVDRRDSTGQLKDTATYTMQIYKSIAGMFNSGNTMRALKYLDQLHLDKNVMLAVGNPDYDKISSAKSEQMDKLGTSYQETAEKAAKLMQQVRELGGVLSDLKDKVFAGFEDKFGVKLAELTGIIRDNLPQIATRIENLVSQILNAANAIDNIVTAISHITEALFKLGSAIDNAIPPWLREILKKAMPGGVLIDVANGKYEDALNKLPSLTDKGIKAASDIAGDPGRQQATALFKSVTNGISSFMQSHLPRGLRNYSPGNIRAGKFATSMGAVGQDKDGFAIFPSLAAGTQAAAALLRSYLAHGINTVDSIIGKWAPSNENDTHAYAQFVAKRLGVRGNKPISEAQIKDLQNSVFSMEVGSDNWKRASLGVDASNNSQHTTINNDIDVNVSGADPQANGAAVLSSIKPWAAQTRNTKGVVY